jgi:hypothetical protein
MRNYVLAALFLAFVAGGLAVASAQTVDTSTTRIKTSKEVTPSWTYKGHWKGFVTCNRLQKDGNTVSSDDVKKCLASGGVCILTGGGRLDLQPKEKCEEFAGQEVLITGTQTEAKYGTGPTSDVAVEGLAAGGDRPATKFQGLTILSAKILPKGPPTAGVTSNGRLQ